jgi:DNA-binding XRE family transcriptional regulator
MVHKLRNVRQRAGYTQADLAARSGVSRQLIGSIENGKHLPRVDAAIAISAALDVTVSDLFVGDTEVVDVVTGLPAREHVLLRTGFVGDRVVSAEVAAPATTWDVADGLIDSGSFTPFGPTRPGFVVAGCEPGLNVVERILRERGTSALSIATSTKTAIEALVGGRVHAGVVHGPNADEIAVPKGLDVARYRMVSWQVGLAAHLDSGDGWWLRALSGSMPVAQREAGAGVQRAFEAVAGSIPGPIVSGHVEAATLASLSGMPAVTIEPAARAAGAAFHPIETHEAQLWIARSWSTESVAAEAMDVITGRRFRKKLEFVGGYDLSRLGDVA